MMRSLQKVGLTLAAVLLGCLLVPLTAHSQHLYYQGGRVLHYPKAHLAFFASDWDSKHSDPNFKKDKISDWLWEFLHSDYYDRAGQYGDAFDSVHGGNLETSAESVLGDPSDSISSVGVHLWLGGEISLLFAGVPYPVYDDDLFVVLVPKGTKIEDAGHSSGHGPGTYTGYHLFTPIGAPLTFVQLPPFYRLSPYIVIPVDAAYWEPSKNPHDFYTDFDALTLVLSHELIEASTDPIPTFVGSVPGLDGLLSLILGGTNPTPGWFDSSLPPGDWPTRSEAADIVEFAPYSDEVWHNKAVVSGYWSNMDNAPAAGGGVVRKLIVKQTGVPLFAPSVIGLFRSPAMLDDRPFSVNGTDSTTQFEIQVVEGSNHTYWFKPIIDRETGARYRAEGWNVGDPARNVTIQGDTSVSANYIFQAKVDFSTNPAAAAIGNATLTPSDWYDNGLVSYTTDQDVSAGTGQRYDFRRWTLTYPNRHEVLPVAGRSGVLNADSWAQMVANYTLQDLLTVNTTGLGTNSTHVYSGTSPLGTASDASPLATWLDDNTTLALSVDDLVDGANGISYFFQGFSTAPPQTLTGPFTTTATYLTMKQLIDGALTNGGIFGPGANGIVNSLQQDWDKVTSDLAAGDYKGAINKIHAFINHVQAQSGKKITVSFANTLQINALRTLYSALVKAKSTGQLDAAKVDTEYTYYQNLMTSLGITPQPHP